MHIGLSARRMLETPFDELEKTSLGKTNESR